MREQPTLPAASAERGRPSTHHDLAPLIKMPDRTSDFGFERVSESEKTTRVREVFESVASRYDLMNDLMSLGLHRLWKRFAISAARLRPGQRVLDLAGGTGDLAALIARRVGDQGVVVLSDINYRMLEIGRDRLLDEGVSRNIETVQADAECLPFADKQFDVVTIAFGLRNVTRKETALAEIHRVLNPGGRVVILEFSKVVVPMLTRLYDTYSFKIIPKIGGWIAKDADSYRYLVESIRMHPDQDELIALMQAAGFERCRYHNLVGGIVALHFGMRL